MLSVLAKTAAAVAAAAGLAYTSSEDFLAGSPYEDGAIGALTEDALANHASAVFNRADRNQDGALDADEYGALAIVTAELALLNGFVVIEGGDAPGLIALDGAAPAALSRAEHIRVAAVARNAFYFHAGDDGRMNEEEYVGAQRAQFDAADLNRNGALHRGELDIFAQRQAMLAVGA